MYSKEELKEKLNKTNPSMDIEIINICLKRWHIDPVYENEEGIEYFDELTIAKLNQGIILKEQGSTDEEIISIINKVITESITPLPVKKSIIQLENTPKEGKLENITIDITNQTLTLLAESIAEKISKDLTQKLNENNINQPIIDMGKLKRDNEILAGQIEKLLEENKKLTETINILLEERDSFKKIYGSFYMKID